MSGMKNLVKRILRWMLTPVRRQSVRRNGAVDTTGRISLPNEHLLPLVAEALEQGHTATIWVKGFSMRPFLEHERDRVKLAYPQQVQVGDAVLARIAPGHYVLHRIVHRDGNLLTLQVTAICEAWRSAAWMMCAAWSPNTCAPAVPSWPMTRDCAGASGCGAGYVRCAACCCSSTRPRCPEHPGRQEKTKTKSDNKFKI